MEKNKFKQTEIDEIPEGWSIGKVSDLVNVRSGYAIKSSDFCKSGVGVIKIKNIDSERVDLFDTDKVTPAFFEALPDEYKVSYRDVLIAMTGATIGKTGKIRSTKERYVLNQRVARFVSNDLWDLEYIFQYTLSREFINSIHNLATGAAQQNISADNIASIPMLIPPKEERLRIAKILSDLDEKIELNNQMNKTLEAIGQAIFKRWFVDFEFPGYEKTKFVNGLPNEWHRGRFGKLAKIQPGYAFKSADFTMTGYGVIKIANIQSGVVDFAQSDYVTNEIFQKTDKKFHLVSGDVAIAMTGAEIGKIGVIPKNDQVMLLNQRVGKLVSNYYQWAYHVLKGAEIQALIDGISSASSTQPNISNSDIEKTEVIIPDVQILKSFCQIMDPLFHYLISNLGENQILSQIRDSLLPRLISGKIRIK